MALFRCASGGGGGGQITVTYDSDFYGQTITCTRGQKVYSKVASSSGSVVFVVNEEGDWLIECTIGQDTYSTTASIEFTTSTELVSIPDGTTVLPTDDVETWLACAGIQDKAYTTLSQVLADSETFNALLGDSNACAYMARSTTWTTDICADQYAMSMIGLYDVCCDALLGNATWASAIVASAYADYVLSDSRKLIPVMTSYTAPSGTIVYSDYYNEPRSALCPFDSNNRNGWQTKNNTTGDYIGYIFDSTISKIDYIEIECGEVLSNNSHTYNFTVQSYDGSTWSDVDSWSIDASKKNYDWSVDLFLETPDVFFKKVNLSNVNGIRVISKTEPLYVSGSNGLMTAGFKIYAFSGDLIHGTNNESAYYLDGATQTPIVDPSTLSAGTYTFGSTVAKDPSDLTADYTKTIRITPNTKEIVLRPDNSLYWWGYESSDLVDMYANGWSAGFTGYSIATSSKTSYYYQITAPASTMSGIASKRVADSDHTLKAIVDGVTAVTNIYSVIAKFSGKSISTITGQTNNTTLGLSLQSVSVLANYYEGIYAGEGRNSKIYALYKE